VATLGVATLDLGFMLRSYPRMRLLDYPYIMVRFACRECPRAGRYRLAALAERFGADADMRDVLEAVSSSCRARIERHRGLTCAAFLPDIPPPEPPDLPRALLPRERLKIIRGGRG
jgi:hypothetical protein